MRVYKKYIYMSPLEDRKKGKCRPKRKRLTVYTPFFKINSFQALGKTGVGGVWNQVHKQLYSSVWCRLKGHDTQFHQKEMVLWVLLLKTTSHFICLKETDHSFRIIAILLLLLRPVKVFHFKHTSIIMHHACNSLHCHKYCRWFISSLYVRERS